MGWRAIAMESCHIPETVALWSRTEYVGLDERCDSVAVLKAHLDSFPGLSRVAVDQAERVVGAVLCGHDSRRGYLHHLAVSTAYRGRGIGHALVDEALECLAKAGLTKCNMFVFDENELAQQFWQRIGWTVRRELVVAQKSISWMG
jgi:N-acetylglutamate synthase